MDTFLSLSAWLMLSGIWDMLISFCSNIAKTEATTACSWSRFYFIEEFDASSTTTCSNVIFFQWYTNAISLDTLTTLAFFYLFERGYARSCQSPSPITYALHICASLGMWTYELVYACSCTHGVHNLIWGVFIHCPSSEFFFDISWKWRLSIQQSSLWPSGQKQEDPHVSTLSSMKVTGTCSHASVFNVGFQDLTSAPHHRLSNTLQIKLFS